MLDAPHPVHQTSHRAAVRAVDPAFMKPLLRLRGADVKPGMSLRISRRVNATPTAVAPGVTAAPHLVSSDLSAMVHIPDRAPQKSETRGALLWLFGGGLVTGSAVHVNDVASGFAADADIVVVAPDYRVGPEVPYPAAIDDAFAALQWMREHAGELGIDPARIAVGGESAGGGLAAALAQRAFDAGIALRLQLLIAPMLDDRTVTRAEDEGRVTVAWTVRSNRFGWSSYLGHDLDHEETRPYAVPARRHDLQGLAPAWISIGEIDLFYAEAREYAARLHAADVPCAFHPTPGAHHAFEIFTPHHPRVRELNALRIDALRTALAP